MKKKIVLFSLFTILILSFLNAIPFNKSISAMELAKKMECGWNLGNTLDARESWSKKNFPKNDTLKSETIWGEELTTEAIIKTGYSYGYKTIRLPVTWCNHIIDDNYTIDPKWMARVKEIVDWSINTGYYVILNEHHSVHDNMNSPLKHCEGYIANSKDEKESKAFLQAIWKQICENFNNDYDEHLIFETMNEPRNTSHEHCWSPQIKNCAECKTDVRLINEYNQLILDTIRKSGGNNANRFVMIPGNGTSIETALADYFVLPKDSASDKIMVTVHMYPLDAGGTGKQSHHFDSITKNDITRKFASLNKKFSSKGIPVVLGECGASRKAGTYWDNGIEKKITDYVVTYEDRLNCFTHIAEQTGKYSMPIINWDCGGIWGMATIDRKKCKAVEKEYIDSVVSAWNKACKNPESISTTFEAEGVRISDFKVWDQTSSSYNADTGLIKFGAHYKGGDIWFGEKDISDSKNLLITYSNASTQFQCWIAYTDGSESQHINCKAVKESNTIKIPLDSSKTLKQILLIGGEKSVTITLEKISFSPQ